MALDWRPVMEVEPVFGIPSSCSLHSRSTMTATATQPVFRFAPSPNGYLHAGHAYSALKNDQLARRHGGRLLLRIEDIDLERAKPEFEAAIYEDLAWLGVPWETPVRRQSEHFADYERALTRLAEMGCLYPCFCTRGDIGRIVTGNPTWPRNPDGEPIYPGTCKALAPADAQTRLKLGQPAARRLAKGRATRLCPQHLAWQEFHETDALHEVLAEPVAWGDAVLARKDFPATYTIAAVVDDALQGVSDVVRGQDLFPTTSLQRLLQSLLGLPAPRYHHHTLVRDRTGAKLSKSSSSTALRSLRADGVTPEALRRQLGFACR